MNHQTTDERDYFEDVPDDELRGWRRYLQCQADLFGARELSLLHQLGLGRDVQTILDLGCGTGVFTKLLHGKFPDSKLLGADANADLLGIFRQEMTAQESGSIGLCTWTVGSGPCPGMIQEAQPEHVVMRLVLQHVADQVSFLSSIKRSFRPGTKIFVIEEDDGLNLLEPKFEAFERVLAIYKKWGESVGSSRTTGRRLPRLASEAGLRVLSLDILCHTSTNLGLKELLEYYRISVEDIPDETYTPQEARNIGRGLQEYAETHGHDAFFYYPQVFSVLEVPDDV